MREFRLAGGLFWLQFPTTAEDLMATQANYMSEILAAVMLQD
jgi:hypothetical protein